MLATIDDYVTKTTADGKLDYCLIVVHPNGGYSMPDPRIPFHAHILGMAKEAKEMFMGETLELVKPTPKWEIEGGVLLKGLARQLPSEKGEMYGRAHGYDLSKIGGVVLTGKYFGMCHADAYSSCISHGVKEIHVPQDGLNGFERKHYPELVNLFPENLDYTAEFRHNVNPFLDVTRSKRFWEYVSRTWHTGNYQLFVPKRKEAYAGVVNGEEPLLVVFHRSWREMMGFFEERRNGS